MHVFKMFSPGINRCQSSGSGRLPLIFPVLSWPLCLGHPSGIPLDSGSLTTLVFVFMFWPRNFLCLLIEIDFQEAPVGLLKGLQRNGGGHLPLAGSLKRSRYEGCAVYQNDTSDLNYNNPFHDRLHITQIKIKRARAKFVTF